MTVDTFVGAARVDAAIFALRPDYRALLLAADGITPGSSDSTSETLLLNAEKAAGEVLADNTLDQVPHVAAWREAYRSFGAKPKRTRNSLEALLRRVSNGLPRVNRLTDIYNAVSVLHQLPLGGEDADRYQGAPRLSRAAGSEPFDTVASGEPVTEHPAPGEVVWTDDAGVTCRCWNWRQGRRTALTEATTRAVFILDALDPMTDDQLWAAADDLATHLGLLGEDVRIAKRLINAESTPMSPG